MSEWRETNKAWWDERVPIHVASGLYDVDGFLAGASKLFDFVVEEVGDVAGLRIEWLHEHPYTFAAGWPFLVHEGRVHCLPDGVPSLPLMYSLLATAPA